LLLLLILPSLSLQVLHEGKAREAMLQCSTIMWQHTQQRHPYKTPVAAQWAGLGKFLMVRASGKKNARFNDFNASFPLASRRGLWRIRLVVGPRSLPSAAPSSTCIIACSLRGKSLRRQKDNF
jgi:hypothetical protein